MALPFSQFASRIWSEDSWNIELTRPEALLLLRASGLQSNSYAACCAGAIAVIQSSISLFCFKAVENGMRSDALV